MHPLSPYHQLFRAALALALATLSGCSSCSEAPRAGGPTPYVRCAMAEAPPAREVRVGALTLTTRGRDLVIDGAGERARIAALRGPAPRGEDLGETIDVIAGRAPHLLVLLGSIGDSEAAIDTALGALASNPVPALVLLGGRDDPALFARALERLDELDRQRIVAISSVRRVRIGRVTLIPVAGAPLGRYSRTDACCGTGEDDAEVIVEELGQAGEEEVRMLLSWAAPTGALDEEGGDGGSPLIASLGARLGAPWVIHAWPHLAAGGLREDGTIEEPIAPGDRVLWIDVDWQGIHPVDAP